MAKDLAYLRSRYNRVQQQINDRKRRNSSIQAEVDRLQSVYNQLKNLKNNRAKPLKNEVKKDKCIGRVAWRGEGKKLFDSRMDSWVKEEANYFEKRIDAMMDEINRLKTSKQNEKRSGLGILDGLKSTLRSIGTEIENFFN